MANNLLLIDLAAQNIKTQITALNAEDITKLYDTTLDLVRGKYRFNVIPMDFITREFTDVSSLPNITIDMICYYTMENSELRDAQWLVFLTRISAIRDALLVKANIPSPLATVKIDVNFNDDIHDIKLARRAINCIMSFTYFKYALDT